MNARGDRPELWGKPHSRELAVSLDESKPRMNANSREYGSKLRFWAATGETVGLIRKETANGFRTVSGDLLLERSERKKFA